MNFLRLVVAAPLWLLMAMAPAPKPKRVCDALRRPGEKTVFSFVVASGKTVSVCEGPKSAYLVYRFGTPAKVELQYPSVLDASSWSKFTYFRYFRGGGVANAGLEEHRLSFRNRGVEYELYDRTHAEADEGGNEFYPHEIGINISTGATISGDLSKQCSGLLLTEEQRELVTMAESSF